MRPFRTFILLFTLLAGFLALRFIIPSGLVELPFVSDFLPGLKTSGSISREEKVLSTDTLSVAIAVSQESDSIPPPGTDSSSAIAGNRSMLSAFFDSLSMSGNQIRIMYYGDSQIEGDRITSYLRAHLRLEYGGTGPGLFQPLMPVMYTKTLNVQSSSNWKRYNFLSFSGGEGVTSELGPFMTLCRFTDNGVTFADEEKAWVSISPSVFADTAASEYEYLRILYGHSPEGARIRVFGDNILLFTDTLRTVKGVNETEYYLGGPREVRIEFSGKASPDIYGISIESKTGLIVDNLPQRGSAGLEFTMVERQNLKASYSILDPDLFILHYGLNVVKNLSSDYSYFEKGLVRQLELIKELCPGVPVLVISLNDMAFQDDDTLKSYSNIRFVREAQSRAAKRAGALFWDSYNSMGGEGSIVKWASAKSPLAQTDYVHFTNPGADTISKMLLGNMFSQGDESRADTLIAPFLNADTIKITEPPEERPDSSRGNGNIMTMIERVLSYNPDQPFIFTTPAFWIFFLITLGGYVFVYRRLALRSIYLFLISLYFYFKTGGLFLILLLLVTLIDYTLGILIFRSGKKSTARFWLILSLVSNLGLLAYFKYAEFITETINSVAGTDFRVFDLLSSLSNSVLGTSFDTSYIILPVGISFFTFQSLSYTIDIFRKRMVPVRNIMDFGFYVSFFPHLVAGPIVRASVFMPQIYSKYSLTQREFSHSVFMIVKGLIKKIVISNFIAVNFIDRIFDSPALYSGFENLMAVYGYGLQIYCDFSGYTDIAIGVALILGFRLPINFNSPYKASSITDFWKRWHISLSQWLKDYLYISLGGNRKGRVRTWLNLFITMLLGGLWHGAALRFVIWGGLHGAALAINKIWRSLTGNSGDKSKLLKLAGIILTFNVVSFCWIFFRAENMENVRIMLLQIFNNFSPGLYTDVYAAYAGVFIVILTGYMLHFIPENFKESYRALFIRIPLAAQMVFLLLFALFLWQMRSTEMMPFIYFRF